MALAVLASAEKGVVGESDDHLAFSAAFLGVHPIQGQIWRLPL